MSCKVGGFVQHFPLYMPDLLGIRVMSAMGDLRPKSKHYYLMKEAYREKCMLQDKVDAPK